MIRIRTTSVLLILAMIVFPLFTSCTESHVTAVAVTSGLYPAASRCVCGPKRVDVMLFDFNDVTHASENTPNHYRSIVAEMNASFYRQSYGKMWLVGGEVYGWYESNLALAPLNVTTWHIIHSDADKLEKFANDKANELHLKGYRIAVFAGNVWAWTHIGGGTMIVGEKRWGFDAYMHEFMHMTGLPDLYAYGETKPQDVQMVGEWDLMDSGEEELSAYSRMSLGWLTGDAMATTTTKNPGSFSVNSLDATTGVRALKVKASTSDSFYFLVETRRKTDGLHLVIYYVPAVSGTGGGALLLKAVLGTNPDAERVYFGDR